MNPLKIVALSASLAFLAVPCAQADAIAHKFVRGLAGMSVGVLAFPGSIVQQTREKGWAGIPLGFFMGIPLSVTRELVGAYELATAPIPIPTEYQPILSPEYPWEYFLEAHPR
jgi:putative exosortase-associated protein (TIGR04073 family)